MMSCNQSQNGSESKEVLALNSELNGWMSSLGLNLYSLQKKNLLCDVTIQTNCGGNLNVHSVVLAAGSAVLMDTMITQIKSGFKLAAVTINSEFDMLVWLPLVQFLYTGKLYLKADDIVPQLIKLSSMLQIDQLVSILEKTQHNKDKGQLAGSPITYNSELEKTRSSCNIKPSNIGTKLGDLEDLLSINSVSALMEGKTTRSNNEHFDNFLRENDVGEQHLNGIEQLNSHVDRSEPETTASQTDGSVLATEVYKCTFCCCIFHSIPSLAKHVDVCKNLKFDSDDDEANNRHSSSNNSIDFKVSVEPHSLAGDSKINETKEATRSHKVVASEIVRLKCTNETKDLLKNESETEDCYKNDSEVEAMDYCRSESDKESESECVEKDIDAISGYKANETSTENSSDVTYSNSQSPEMTNKPEEKISQNENSLLMEKDKEKVVNFCCSICGVGLSSRFTLHQHMKLHSSDDNTYRCHKCWKSFQTKNYLSRHMKTMHGDRTKSYICDLCKKPYQFKSHLNTHLKYDHCQDPDSEALHRCNECSKTFRYPVLLKQHLMTHTDSREHNCELCDKGFVLKHDLERHMLSHVDAQPWSCTKCGKRFKYKSSLTHHSQTTCSKVSKSEDSSFPCELCSRIFNEKKNLKAHVKTVHLGVKQYMCDICQRCFSRNSTLKSHVYNMHEKEEAAVKALPASSHPPPIKTTIRMIDGYSKVNHKSQNKASAYQIRSSKDDNDVNNSQDKRPTSPVMMIVNKFVKIQPKLDEMVSGESQLLESVIPQQQDLLDTESNSLTESDPLQVNGNVEPLIMDSEIQEGQLNGITMESPTLLNDPTISQMKLEEEESTLSVSPIDGSDCVPSVSTVGLQFVNTTYPDNFSVHSTSDTAHLYCMARDLPIFSHDSSSSVHIHDGVNMHHNVHLQQPLNVNPSSLELTSATTSTKNMTLDHLDVSAAAHSNMVISPVSITQIAQGQPIFVKSLSSSSVVITNTGLPTTDFENDPEEREFYFVDQPMDNPTNDLSVLNVSEIGSDDCYVKNRLDYSLFNLSSLGKTPDKL